MNLLLRFKFSIGFDEFLVLPIHYNHLLQSFIYNNINDKALQSRYHDRGFQNGNKSFKLFTFSRLSGNYIIDQAKHTIHFKSPVRLTLSSVEDSFLSSFLTEVVESNNLYLNGKRVRIENFEPVNPKWFSTDVQIEMLSPITIYHTELKDGKKYTHYLSPWETEFSHMVSSNLIEKYNIINSYEALENYKISISPMFEENLKYHNVVKFKTTIVNGWMGTYRLQAPLKLIKQAYYAGIGTKNSEGFGCFKIFGSGEN